MRLLLLRPAPLVYRFVPLSKAAGPIGLRRVCGNRSLRWGAVIATETDPVVAAPAGKV
ncbi:MAG: hypothetical protein ACYC9S_10655 [Leptospirales bacterium]